jgi:acyl carrier protein
MNRAIVHEELTRIFREVFDDESLVLRPETTALDVADWDSQAMITLVVAVESRFGVTFRTAEVEQLESVGDFVELIALKCKINA